MALSSTLEKAIHRKGTQRFIDADPTVITLNPKITPDLFVDGTKYSTSETVIAFPIGSSIGPVTAREPQRFKLIWGGESGIVREVPNGVRRFDFIILGSYDAIVEIGDVFEINTNKYVIDYIFPYNDYEVKAGGVSHGANPGNT